MSDRETKRAERRNPGGFVQADPAQIPINPALAPDLRQSIESHLRTAVDPNETVRSVQARDELEKIGVPAIPFLLNELVGGDHTSDEEFIKRAIVVDEVLRRLTGKNFGYGPPTQADPLSGEVSGATPEQRVAAVRGWFGWWNSSGRTFTGRTDDPEKEEDDPRRKPRKAGSPAS